MASPRCSPRLAGSHAHAALAALTPMMQTSPFSMGLSAPMELYDKDGRDNGIEQAPMSELGLMDFLLVLQQTQANLQEMLTDLEAARIECELATQRAGSAEAASRTAAAAAAESESRAVQLAAALQDVQAREAEVRAHSLELIAANMELVTRLQASEAEAVRLRIEAQTHQRYNPAMDPMVTALQASQARAEVAAAESRATRAELELAVANTKLTVAQQESAVQAARSRGLEAAVADARAVATTAQAAVAAAIKEQDVLRMQLKAVQAKLAERDSRLRASSQWLVAASVDLRRSITASMSTHGVGPMAHSAAMSGAWCAASGKALMLPASMTGSVTHSQAPPKGLKGGQQLAEGTAGQYCSSQHRRTNESDVGTQLDVDAPRPGGATPRVRRDEVDAGKDQSPIKPPAPALPQPPPPPQLLQQSVAALPAAPAALPVPDVPTAVMEAPGPAVQPQQAHPSSAGSFVVPAIAPDAPTVLAAAVLLCGLPQQAASETTCAEGQVGKEEEVDEEEEEELDEEEGDLQPQLSGYSTNSETEVTHEALAALVANTAAAAAGANVPPLRQPYASSGGASWASSSVPDEMLPLSKARRRMEMSVGGCGTVPGSPTAHHVPTTPAAHLPPPSPPPMARVAHTQQAPAHEAASPATRVAASAVAAPVVGCTAAAAYSDEAEDPQLAITQAAATVHMATTHALVALHTNDRSSGGSSSVDATTGGSGSGASSVSSSLSFASVSSSASGSSLSELRKRISKEALAAVRTSACMAAARTSLRMSRRSLPGATLAAAAAAATTAGAHTSLQTGGALASGGTAAPAAMTSPAAMLDLAPEAVTVQVHPPSAAAPVPRDPVRSSVGLGSCGLMMLADGTLFYSSMDGSITGCPIPTPSSCRPSDGGASTQLAVIPEHEREAETYVSPHHAMCSPRATAASPPPSPGALSQLQAACLSAVEQQGGVQIVGTLPLSPRHMARTTGGGASPRSGAMSPRTRLASPLHVYSHAVEAAFSSSLDTAPAVPVPTRTPDAGASPRSSGMSPRTRLASPLHVFSHAVDASMASSLDSVASQQQPVYGQAAHSVPRAPSNAMLRCSANSALRLGVQLHQLQLPTAAAGLHVPVATAVRHSPKAEHSNRAFHNEEPSIHSASGRGGGGVKAAACALMGVAGSLGFGWALTQVMAHGAGSTPLMATTPPKQASKQQGRGQGEGGARGM